MARQERERKQEQELEQACVQELQMDQASLALSAEVQLKTAVLQSLAKTAVEFLKNSLPMSVGVAKEIVETLQEEYNLQDAQQAKA